MVWFRTLSWRAVWSTAAAVLAVAVGGACSRQAQPDTAAASGATVSVSPARVTTLLDTITAAGTVVPIPAADFTVYAPQPARVAALPVHEGDAVQAGDVLVRFDVDAFNDEVAARQTDVSLATVHLSAAKSEAEQSDSLYSRGIIARNVRDASQQAVAAAQTALADAQARLDAARRQQDSATIKARFAGTVVKCWHAEGDLVGVSLEDPVLRVVDPTRVQVVVTLSIAELMHIVPGQAATITAEGGASGVPATVTIRPMPSDPTAKTAEIRLAFANPTTLPLDTPVEAEILLDRRSNVVAVPREAILHDQDGSYVFVAADDGRAHRAAVRVGLVTRDLAQVLAGVSAGDRVITTGLDGLVDGMPVSIQQ
jgi:membrane fusion protein, multidrug efflux system